MNSYLLSDVDRIIYRTFDDFWPKKYRLSANLLRLVFQKVIPRVKRNKLKKKVYPGESKVLVFSKIGREQFQTFDKNSLPALSKRHSTWPE